MIFFHPSRLDRRYIDTLNLVTPSKGSAVEQPRKPYPLRREELSRTLLVLFSKFMRLTRHFTVSERRD
jgi:hypothetical protein